MSVDLLQQVLLLEMHKKNYDKKERAQIKKELCKKCRKVLKESGKTFIKSMDDITNL